MAVDDIEARPETLKVNETEGFRAGCLQPQSAVIFAHQIPLGIRKNFQNMYRRNLSLSLSVSLAVCLIPSFSPS